MAVDANNTPEPDSETSPNDAGGKRPGEKRLTLALDGDTYKRLRRHAAETDQTHQAILEAALKEVLPGGADILPCPFCGGTARLEGRMRGWIVSCENRELNNGCPVNMRTHHTIDKKTAVALWNTRSKAVTS
jgi:hypothetical protein